ncbi:MAG TPA: hypothetical protein VHX14_14105 [Thermoanaerobaculia bacterium]|nr:hypothetical protein [Thermoanaerobaculia bacterium]
MRGLHMIAAALLMLLSAGCNSPTSPDSGTPAQHGRLSGIVTIGPNCPGPQTDTGCPTQPSAYAARKILVYTESKSNLLFTVDIDSQGAYFIDLAPGRYTIDLKPSGIDKTGDLPKLVEIHANTVTSLNVSIDTGIR